jgi:hypothetical protein
MVNQKEYKSPIRKLAVFFEMSRDRLKRQIYRSQGSSLQKNKHFRLESTPGLWTIVHLPKIKKPPRTTLRVLSGGSAFSWM